MSVTPANTATNRILSNRQARLLHLYQTLLDHFGPRHWWPAENAWEMMVGAILTQNTNWTNVEKALASLKSAKALSLRRMASLPRARLEKLIRSSGFFRQKATRLQEFAGYLKDNPRFHKRLLGQSTFSPRRVGEGRDEGGPPHPNPLPPKGGRGEYLDKLRNELLSLKGIGPETADSMLLYAGNHPIFLVDAYTRRIGQRLGLFKTNDYHEVQAYFEHALPRKAPLYNEFHALLVWLAKHYCKSREPLCGACPMSQECAFGHKRMAS